MQTARTRTAAKNDMPFNKESVGVTFSFLKLFMHSYFIYFAFINSIKQKRQYIRFESNSLILITFVMLYIEICSTSIQKVRAQ